jgi:hypothetical protein
MSYMRPFNDGSLDDPMRCTKNHSMKIDFDATLFFMICVFNLIIITSFCCHKNTLYKKIKKKNSHQRATSTSVQSSVLFVKIQLLECSQLNYLPTKQNNLYTHLQ